MSNDEQPAQSKRSILRDLLVGAGGALLATAILWVFGAFEKNLSKTQIESLSDSLLNNDAFVGTLAKEIESVLAGFENRSAQLSQSIKTLDTTVNQSIRTLNSEFNRTVKYGDTVQLKSSRGYLRGRGGDRAEKSVTLEGGRSSGWEIEK